MSHRGDVWLAGLATSLVAGLVIGSTPPVSARTPTVVPASPVPKVGTQARPTILPLIFEVEALDGSESSRRIGAATTIALSSDVFFEFGSAELMPSALARLDKLVGKVEGASGNVELVGHADNVGSDSVNMPLSRQRAEAVATVLRSRLPGIMLSVDGRGSAAPVATNTINGHDNPAGRARNRRVEITYKK